MKKYILILLILTCSLLSADKYAGEIFRMGAGVRSFALGGIGLTDVNSNAMAYWNSALLTMVEDNRFELMHAEEYEGLLTYDTALAIWGEHTKLSVILTRIGINDIPLTKLENPDLPPSHSNRPYEYKSVNNSDIVLFVGIARTFGKYNIGLTPKFAYRSLAEESGFGFGADISTYFQLRDDLLIGIKIRDFFSTQILWSNGTHEIVNPGVDLEGSYSFLLPVINRMSILYLAADVYTENRDTAATTSFGFLSSDFHAGLEVLLHDRLNFFLGYDVENLTSGLTVNYRSWNINYGFEYSSQLRNSHRISIGYRL